MAKYSSAKAKILLVDGYNLLGAKPKGLTDKITNKLQSATHGLGDDWEESSATGLLAATVTQTGAFFDDATAGMHDAFKAATQVVRLLVYALFGNVIGQPFVGVQGVYQGAYTLLTKIGALTNADAEYVVAGQIDRGTIIQDWVAKAANWNTKTDGFPVDHALNPNQTPIPITSNTIANPTVVTTPVPHKLTTGDVVLISGVITSTPTINGERTVTVISPTTFSIPVNVSVAGTGGSFVRSSSNNGGVAYLAVSAFTGFTAVTVKVRSSADDITYADLVTFAPVTAPPPDVTAAQRVTVAGTIARYLSVSGTVTGAGSLQPFVGFKRNAPL
jgi:hypothetical protein